MRKNDSIVPGFYELRLKPVITASAVAACEQLRRNSQWFTTQYCEFIFHKANVSIFTYASPQDTNVLFTSFTNIKNSQLAGMGFFALYATKQQSFCELQTSTVGFFKGVRKKYLVHYLYIVWRFDFVSDVVSSFKTKCSDANIMKY